MIAKYGGQQGEQNNRILSAESSFSDVTALNGQAPIPDMLITGQEAAASGAAEPTPQAVLPTAAGETGAESSLSINSSRQTTKSTLYEQMRKECERIEENLLRARREVYLQADVAFLMQRSDTELSNLQIAQAKEIKEKIESFEKNMKGRSERKETKKFQRTSVRRTKYRDMLILKQQTISKAATAIRLTVVEQREAFDNLMAHVKAIHEQQRIDEAAALERKLDFEKSINDLEIVSQPDEVKSALAKMFQVRQTHQRALNKRINEHLREVQMVEVRHVKEKFDLERNCAEEAGNLKVLHAARIAEQIEAHVLEMNNEKERLQAEHEAKKQVLITHLHQVEVKRLQHAHRLALRNMKSEQEQRLAAFKHQRLSGNGLGTGVGSISSKLTSKMASRQESNADIDDASSDRSSQVSASPSRIAAGINGITPASSTFGGTRRSGNGSHTPTGSHISEDDDIRSTHSDDSRTHRVNAIASLVAKQRQEKTNLMATLKAEMTELEQSHSAQMGEMEEEQRLELEKLVMEQREELELLRALQEKEILVEQSVHEAEMVTMVERRVLNSVFASVNDGIINTTSDGTITRFNPAAVEIFGYTAAEAIGQNVSILMPDDIAKDHNRFILSYMNTGIKKVVGKSRRLEGKCKNGEIFPMQLSLSEVKEQDEHLFTAVARDLTKKVQLENEIREKEELEQRELQKLIGELDVTKAKTEDLLSQMLPRSVANQLMDGKQVTPQTFDNATVFFLDVVGFTTMCASMHPTETVSLLDAIYNTFDEVIQKYDAYKVETIGDSYLIVSGIPTPNGDRHASEIATLALEIMSKVHLFQFERNPSLKLRVRIGLNTGPVVAGVVGTKMPRYCLFGDTVNTGSRMESTSQPMRIQISESTCAMLKAAGGFQIVDRGEIDVKASCVLRAVLGKGKMRTYFLNGKENFPFELPSQ
ncbi:hypothetical protein HK105_200384 [Polyrhizophydium stewartii]|uniref:guanylate cyclase n=1 Tax=Polyrhizophydium stewartii TaxID=2732419 RepID=A0ABR4NLH1_9FUNG